MTTDDDTYCAGQVQRHDPDRYLLTLLAPKESRAGLFSVYAFNIEIARIRETVSEALLGEIRLQWWRDAIDTLYSGGRLEHAVARPLGEAIRRHDLSRENFERLIEGRSQDLDDQPLETMDDLMRYAEETSAPLVHLALEAMGVRDPDALSAGTHAGTAWALSGLIRALPVHMAAGWRYLPAALCETHGLSAGDLSREAGRAQLVAAVRDLSASVENEITAAQALRGKVPRAAVPALLPVSFARYCQDRLRKAGYDPYDQRVAMPPPMIAWRLACRAAFGRY